MARDALPQAEYEQIYARVPRLTVEVVVSSEDGVLLTLRKSGPCRGLWHLPGGTVRYGEPLTDAVQRVSGDELGIEVTTDELLGYIEYPSHLQRGLDWPVGIAFAAHLVTAPEHRFRPLDSHVRWFKHLPSAIHDEQKVFLKEHGLIS
jgi:8-oxo-dGTP diphosphatase